MSAELFKKNTARPTRLKPTEPGRPARATASPAGSGPESRSEPPPPPCPGRTRLPRPPPSPSWPPPLYNPAGAPPRGALATAARSRRVLPPAPRRSRRHTPCRPAATPESRRSPAACHRSPAPHAAPPQRRSPAGAPLEPSRGSRPAAPVFQRKPFVFLENPSFVFCFFIDQFFSSLFI